MGKGMASSGSAYLCIAGFELYGEMLLDQKKIVVLQKMVDQKIAVYFIRVQIVYSFFTVAGAMS